MLNKTIMTKGDFLKADVFYQSEIEYARSLLKSDYSDFEIIGDEENYFYESLKDVLSNSSKGDSDNVCVIAVLCGSTNKSDIMKQVAGVVSSGKCKRCIICDDNNLPFNNKGIIVSEREFVCLAEDKSIFEKSEALQRIVTTNLLIFDKIIGPGSGNLDFLNVTDGKISVTDDDASVVRGYTYLRDALCAVLLSFNKLKGGNIYNVSSFKVSDYEMKQKLHMVFSDKFSFSCELNVQKEKKTKALCPLKIKSYGFSETDFDSAVYLTFSSAFGFEHDYNKNLSQYCSKLDILKKTEIEILKEIDRICKKNGIKYFLTGGTLLGAVRYGKSIPWDDDLDIGMLREDFEKFRKVCPQEIDKNKFAYASYTTEENCHYLFDKIRLKNTYFSTGFSSQYKIEDGVFVDVFVYDTTSPQKKNQSLHINLVKTAIRFLNLRWTGKADRSMNGYRLTRLVKPFVMKIPFKMLHRFSDNMLKLYNRKNSDYLIDGTGLNINRGAFRREYLEVLTETDFEGMCVPIPEKYDDFLKHVYGENYLSEPHLYQRTGTHDFVRLDLGEYITDNWEINKQQSLEGELF